MITAAVATSVPQDLSKLFEEAYAVAPHKSQFCDNMTTLPGVVCIHQQVTFCEGYLKSLVDNNLPCYGHQLVSFIGSAFSNERHFLLSDATEFIKACIAMKKRNFVRVPTPRGVLIKMVKLRLDKVYKNAVWFSVHTAARAAVLSTARLSTARYASDGNIVPDRVVMSVLNSKEACMEWCLENTMWTHKDGRRALEDLLRRDDIPDDVYQEAWNLFEVNMVMDS